MFVSWLWRYDGASGQRGQAGAGVHVEGFLVDFGAPDFLALKVDCDKLKIDPGAQVVVVTVYLRADQGVGENALSAVEHNLSLRPGGVILLLDVADADEKENGCDFVGIFDFGGDGDGVRSATAPIDFLWRVFD